MSHSVRSVEPTERTATIKRFYAVGTCSLASHIALEDAGAEYSTVRIRFETNERGGPEYLAINPKRRVPAMFTDRGILTETPRRPVAGADCEQR